MSGFRVGVTALSSPTQRLKQISFDLRTAGSGAATAVSSGGGAAGDPAVVSAAAVFEAAVRTVLGALGDDAGLLGDKVQRAGVTYETTDATALPRSPGGPTAAGGPITASGPIAASGPTVASSPITAGGPITATPTPAAAPAPAGSAPAAGMCGTGP